MGPLHKTRQNKNLAVAASANRLPPTPKASWKRHDASDQNDSLYHLGSRVATSPQVFGSKSLLSSPLFPVRKHPPAAAATAASLPSMAVVTPASRRAKHDSCCKDEDELSSKKIAAAAVESPYPSYTITSRRRARHDKDCYGIETATDSRKNGLQVAPRRPATTVVMTSDEIGADSHDNAEIPSDYDDVLYKATKSIHELTMLREDLERASVHNAILLDRLYMTGAVTMADLE